MKKAKKKKDCGKGKVVVILLLIAIFTVLIFLMNELIKSEAQVPVREVSDSSGNFSNNTMSYGLAFNKTIPLNKITGEPAFSFVSFADMYGSAQANQIMIYEVYNPLSEDKDCMILIDVENATGSNSSFVALGKIGSQQEISGNLTFLIPSLDSNISARLSCR